MVAVSIHEKCPDMRFGSASAETRVGLVKKSDDVDRRRRVTLQTCDEVLASSATLGGFMDTMIRGARYGGGAAKNASGRVEQDDVAAWSSAFGRCLVETHFKWFRCTLKHQPMATDDTRISIPLDRPLYCLPLASRFVLWMESRRRCLVSVDWHRNNRDLMSGN